MAAGDQLLGSDGRRLLQTDGAVHLSDGAGDECCCGSSAGCVDLNLGVIDEDDNSYGVSITPDPVVTLTWSAYIPGGSLTVTDYTLQRRLYGTGSYADVVSAGTSLSVDDDTISSGVRYEWRVRVTMSDASVVYSCSTNWCTCGVPADMGTPSATITGPNQVSVTWTTPTYPAGCNNYPGTGQQWDNAGDEVELWGSYNGGPYNYLDFVATDGSASYTITHTTAASGTWTYKIRLVVFTVNGVCGSAVSDASNTVTVP